MTALVAPWSADRVSWPRPRSGLASPGVLPEPDDRPLAVGEITSKAHVPHGLPAAQGLTAALLDLRQGGIDVLDGDRDQGLRQILGSGKHATVDLSGRRGPAHIVCRGRSAKQGVVHIGHGYDIPSKRVAIEGPRPLDVVGGKLKVDDWLRHD